MIDLDGTLAHRDDRRGPYDTARCGSDRLDKELPGLIEYYRSQGCAIIITTGRKECFRQETTCWLTTNAIQFGAMHMRATEDNRRDDVIKREMYELHIRGKYTVRLIFDDRERVVHLWRSLGLPCYQVADGNF